jgi:hypothetical protein
MPDDLDHEVIDSPRALFRHLYEAHGLVEALDLDPDTAPLQFWLRKHAELERAATRAAVQERLAAAADPAAAAQVGVGSPDRAEAAQERPAASAVGGGPPAAGASPPRRPAGQGSGPRFRPFADPLVEALAVALVGRGLDERQVRRGLSTFSGATGRHGEEAVRSAFIAPMLDAVAAHLNGNPSEPAPRGPAPRMPLPGEPAAPERAATRAERPARAEPPAGEPETWVAQPLAVRGQGPEPEVDFMAIADVLQERRRSRRGGRREATAARAAPQRATPAGAGQRGTTPPAGAGQRGTTPPAARPERQEPDDDYMALANALQRRRRNRPH